MEIFREVGFDIKIIGKRVLVNSLARWRKVYADLWQEGLLLETRGKNTVENNNPHLSNSEKLKKAHTKLNI